MAGPIKKGSINIKEIYLRSLLESLESLESLEKNKLKLDNFKN
tara:strand:+ start:238 stop:366 length:129 start_codon:yes stop_codon:yes gene_type:complete